MGLIRYKQQDGCSNMKCPHGQTQTMVRSNGTKFQEVIIVGTTACTMCKYSGGYTNHSEKCGVGGWIVEKICNYPTKKVKQ